jgi:hypothetical protein
MKKVAIWDLVECGCCKNRLFGGTYRLRYPGETIVNGSSETSILTRTTRRRIPEGDIFHDHRRGNLKSDRINRLCSIAETLYVAFDVRTGVFISKKTAFFIIMKISNLT